MPPPRLLCPRLEAMLAGLPLRGLPIAEGFLTVGRAPGLGCDTFFLIWLVLGRLGADGFAAGRFTAAGLAAGFGRFAAAGGFFSAGLFTDTSLSPVWTFWRTSLPLLTWVMFLRLIDVLSTLFEILLKSLFLRLFLT